MTPIFFMQTEQKAQAYWDQNADKKHFSHPLDSHRFQRLISCKDAAILDYGCGYGRMLQNLRQLGYDNLNGVDYSARMIELGRKLNPELNLTCNSQSTLPFADNSFDCVLLFALLTCNPANKQQQLLINETNRVLKPNGIIYISDYLLQTDQRNTQRYEYYVNKYGIYGVFEIDNGMPVRHHDRPHITSLLADFDDLSYQLMTTLSMNNHPSRIFQYFGRIQK